LSGESAQVCSSGGGALGEGGSDGDVVSDVQDEEPRGSKGRPKSYVISLPYLYLTITLTFHSPICCPPLTLPFSLF
jgi:hypothetical protein